MIYRRKPRKVVATRTMERRRRRRRALVALGITSALVAGTAYGTWRFIEQNEYLLNERCEVTVGDQTIELTPERARAAAIISAEAVDRGLPPAAAVHGVAMSMQESDLLASDEEDEEEESPALFSRGAPSWADGASAQVAETSVDGFFEVLEDSWQEGRDADDEEDGDPQYWDPELSLDEAAEVLERPHNAQFYPQHATRARAFAWPLTGQQPVDMTCHLSQLDVPEADPEGFTAQLAASLPNALDIPLDEADEEPVLEDIIDSTGEGEGATLVVEVPEEGDFDYQWMLAHWSVAMARDYGVQSVEAGPYTWHRDSGRWDRTTDGSTGPTEVVVGFSRDS